MQDFVIGVNYTYRKYTGALYPHRTGLTENDYEVGGTLTGRLYNGQEFDQPYYQLKPGVPVPSGVTLSNRPDWDTTYNGVDLTFQKRLTNKWLIRGGGTYQNWNQHGGAGSCYEPTSDRGGNNELWPGTPVGIQTGSTCAGDDIAALPAGAASGARNEVFLNSRWLFNVGGLYQLPWDFAVAANFFGREGYPYINYYRFDPGDGLGNRDNIIGQALRPPLRQRVRARPAHRESDQRQARPGHDRGGHLQRAQPGHHPPAQREGERRRGRLQPDHRDAEPADRALRRPRQLLGTALHSVARRASCPPGFFLRAQPCFARAVPSDGGCP